MPTAAFHSFYWQTTTPSAPAGGASSIGGHFPFVVQFGIVLAILVLQGS